MYACVCVVCERSLCSNQREMKGKQNWWRQINQNGRTKWTNYKQRRIESWGRHDKKQERIIISIGVGETNDEVRFFIYKFVTSDSTTVGWLVGLIHYPLLFSSSSAFWLIFGSRLEYQSQNNRAVWNGKEESEKRGRKWAWKRASPSFYRAPQ